MVEVITEHTFKEEDQNIKITKLMISRLLKDVLFLSQDKRCCIFFVCVCFLTLKQMSTMKKFQ